MKTPEEIAKEVAEEQVHIELNKELEKLGTDGNSYYPDFTVKEMRKVIADVFFSRIKKRNNVKLYICADSKGELEKELENFHNAVKEGYNKLKDELQ